jgi:signal transduction histidine kinase
MRGLLIISGKESGLRFQDEDIEFLSILANQTAVSIENARLYESEKEARLKLQQAQTLLLQSERMATLGELSARLAHEINNPLGIIKNYLQLLNRLLIENKRGSDYVKIVMQEINRIAVIIRRLLDLGRPMDVKFESVDVLELIYETTGMLSAQLKEAQIDLRLEIAKPLPNIMAWPDGLRQVFLNLILNSKDAIGSNGNITIEVITGKQTIQILLADSGPGINSEDATRIFEPFFSTKDLKSGTGLGLSVCRQIITNHNGSIEVCPDKKGGCFRIELPIEQEKTGYEY